MGNGAARSGNARWRRLTEERAGGAKSVFHFDVQGSVAKSNSCRDPLAALHPPGTPAARAFLAVRRLGYPRRPFRDCRGLSVAVAPRLRDGRTRPRSARRLLRRRLARARRPRRYARGLSEARPLASRARGGAGRGQDFRRSRLDPRNRKGEDFPIRRLRSEYV